MKQVADPHPPSRSGLPATVFVAAVGLGLLAACGQGSSSPPSADSSSAGGSSRSPSAAAFSACMRSHDVPNFPDPDPNGRPLQVDAQQLGVSDSLYQVAEHACSHLLPTGGSLEQQTHQCLLYGDCPPALVQQLLTIGRRYAQCMRAHGVPSWPDPTISAKGGRPVFDLTAAGIDPQSTDSPQLSSVDRECRQLIGGSIPRLPTT
jgi:hypothetical protein